MRKISTYLLLFLIITVGVQTAKSELISEKRSVSGFEKVKLHGSGIVYLSQDDEETLTIEAAADIFPYIESQVSGRTLGLGMKRNYRGWGRTRPINYYLTMKDVSGIRISGSGDIIAGELKTDALDIHISGSGDIEIGKIVANQISAHISGSGECQLSGKSDYQDIHISGSGDYEASKLKSDRVDVSVSGSGDVTVWVDDKLDVYISGSGKVGYYGRPAVSTQSSGSGQTRHLGDR
ncbi:MAG: DUF2807 domain-containing protein [Candidatus Marinimicrobia bacterium]|nr:DUF2807 domain-containing protein [Candidatus Neomarinimicrobiota bacterium]